MKIKRVRIIKPSIYWYANKIGDEFYVRGSEISRSEFGVTRCDSYQVIHVGTHEGSPPRTLEIGCNEVEVLEEFEADVVTITTIFLRRGE